MEDYKPNNQEIIGALKKQFKDFIRISEVLNDQQKNELIKEIGDNWYDGRFSAEPFIESAVSYSVYEWKKHNIDLTKLWIDVAVNNSTNCDTPDITADKAVKAFEEKFNQ